MRKVMKNKIIKKGDGSAPKQSRQGIPFKTSKGQHILKNPGIVHTIIEKSAIKPTDIVMEVGPGTGNLSMRLLDRAKKLIAYEIDSRLVAELKKRVIGTPVQYKLQVLQCDVVKQEKWLPFDVCVTNLPFQISSPFIFKLLQHRPLPRYAVIMLQKEFAERLLARPGQKTYCRLSANVQLLSRVEHLMKVKRTEFRPPPKVDSAVVRLEPINPPPPINYNEWDGLLRLAFLRKNKTLQSIFKQKQVLDTLVVNFDRTKQAESVKQEATSTHSLEVIKNKVEEVLRRTEFAARRARSMSVEDFLALLLAFNETNIYFSSSTRLAFE